MLHRPVSLLSLAASLSCAVLGAPAGAQVTATVGPPSAPAGCPTCAGTVPLDGDLLLALSLQTPAVFQGFAGVLDGAGRSLAPVLAIPGDPALVGLDYVLAFVVLDASSACAVRRISAPLALEIE